MAQVRTRQTSKWQALGALSLALAAAFLVGALNGSLVAGIVCVVFAISGIYSLKKAQESLKEQ